MYACASSIFVPTAVGLPYTNKKTATTIVIAATYYEKAEPILRLSSLRQLSF
jgi:hypothetical protein